MTAATASRELLAIREHLANGWCRTCYRESIFDDTPQWFGVHLQGLRYFGDGQHLGLELELFAALRIHMADAHGVSL